MIYLNQSKAYMQSSIK